MFDQLSDRLQESLSGVRSRGKLTEADVDRAMREIRLALLEADVNFKVVKQFTSQVRERCLGAGVLDSLNPGQQVTKIVNEELTELMAPASAAITCHWGSTLPTMPYASSAPAAGRTTVWIPSHTLSIHGILSATNSTEKSDAAARRTGVVVTT